MEPPARPLATRLTAQPPTPTPRPRPRAGSSGAARCGVAREAGPAGAFASLGLARQRERRQATGEWVGSTEGVLRSLLGVGVLPRILVAFIPAHFGYKQGGWWLFFTILVVLS